MAEEKPRATRARKQTTKAETEAAEGKTTAKRPSRAKAAASTPKPAAKKKMAAATSRPREATVAAVEPHDVATLAYLLWEQGEPGDAAEHWLRAEQELAAA
jgi:hypothetical protein